jgi:hypothetical protein
MSDKRFWPWLLLLTIALAGCEKARPEKQAADAGKGQPAKAEKALPQEKSSVTLGTVIVPKVSRTPDMPAYRWSADFKLPLEITMDAPEVPKEIANPSPPIEGENQQEDIKNPSPPIEGDNSQDEIKNPSPPIVSSNPQEDIKNPSPPQEGEIPSMEEDK